jgi:putative ABC transport system permease protein
MAFRSWRSRLRALWHRRRQEADLDAEIEFHLSEDADERAASGLAREDARYAARRDFGNALRIREEMRDAWGWGSTERLLQDVRYGLRTMRRNPAFAAMAICTLALGIGATTSIFSVVQALVLRPLPFVEPDRLVVLFATTPARGIDRDTTSFLDFTAWRDQTHGLVNAAAYRQDAFNITGDGPPEPVTGLRASHELLGVLGGRSGSGWLSARHRASSCGWSRGMVCF